MRTNIPFLSNTVGSFWGLATIFLGVVGCGDGTEGTKTAEVCADRELENQCPVGTAPNLAAAAMSQCSTSAQGGASQGSTGDVSGQASLDQVCIGTGTCQIACEVIQGYCAEFGVKSLSRNELVCATADDRTACGNGTCDPGETPATCPSDCGAECETGASRCDGVQIQECNALGRWESRACPADEECRFGDEAASCEPLPRSCEAGAARCDGEQIQECSPHGMWVSRDCEAQHECRNVDDTVECLPIPRTCEPGTLRCDGQQIQECTPQADWETRDCEGGQECRVEDDVAACLATPLDCEPGSTRCDGPRLQECTPQAHWDARECEPGNECRTENGESACRPLPRVCEPDQQRCNGDGFQGCTDLGQWGEVVGCPAEQICDEETAACAIAGPPPECAEPCTCLISGENRGIRIVGGVAINTMDRCVELVCSDPGFADWLACIREGLQGLVCWEVNIEVDCNPLIIPD